MAHQFSPHPFGYKRCRCRVRRAHHRTCPSGLCPWCSCSSFAVPPRIRLFHSKSRWWRCECCTNCDCVRCPTNCATCHAPSFVFSGGRKRSKIKIKNYNLNYRGKQIYKKSYNYVESFLYAEKKYICWYKTEESFYG